MGFNWSQSFAENTQDSFNKAESRLLNAQSIDDAIIDSSFEKSDKFREDLTKVNSSYSGTDCTVLVQINEKIIVLGNLETFSYSIFREKSPVRVLGKSHPKGYTAGGRTIAGSMVFIVFDRHPLYDIIKEINYVRSNADRFTSPIPDQLPPLDLIIIFNNEYGHKSLMRLYGVEFMQEGQVMSVNDLYTENTMQYVARDIDIMINYDRLTEFKDMMFERQSKGLFQDNYLGSLLEYKSRIESQIQDVNSKIYNIDVETNRREIAGVTTLGLSNLINYGVGFLPGVETVTRSDLNRAKSEQLKIKDSLLNELTTVNREITLYEQNIKGWNAQNGQTGNVGHDYTSHAGTAT